MGRALQGVVVGALLVTLALADGCRAPTQVTLVVSVVGGCANVSDVDIYVGDDPRTLESQKLTGGFSTTQTSQCADGVIGTLVVTPSDATSRGAVAIVAGIGQSATACRSPGFLGGCVVARRQFSFLDHTSLTLPISIDVACKPLPCDAVTTCNVDTCVSSEVFCEGDSCDLPRTPPGEGGVDGARDGGDEAMPTLDATVDGDAATVDDGEASAPTALTCSNGVGANTTCAMGEYCCYSEEKPNNAACDTNEANCHWSTRRCNGSADCPSGKICCVDMITSGSALVQGQNTSCLTNCGANPQFCLSSNDCTPPATCQPKLNAPGEKSCQ